MFVNVIYFLFELEISLNSFHRNIFWTISACDIYKKTMNNNTIGCPSSINKCSRGSLCAFM